MKVDQIKEYLSSISSGSQSYKDLLQYDCLFEIKGRWPDDNDLNDIFYDLDHSKFLYWQKLRGDHDTSHPKLADRDNDSEFCHGYIVFVDKRNSESVEKELIVSALRNNIFVKKIDVSLIEAENIKKNKEHFNSLFNIV
jgi:hypothetical protein